MCPSSSLDLPVETKESEWTIIRSKQGLFDLHLREIWRYRGLIRLFAWRDFISVYKQSILGPLWYMIQPVMTTVMFMIVFAGIARLPTGGVPAILFYFSGIILWGYFGSSVTKTSNVFVANSNLFSKIYFPRLSLPLSVMISNLVSFGVQICLFLLLLFFYLLNDTRVQPNSWILLTPLLLINVAALALGSGCLVSSLTIRYRDLSFLVSFGLQLWMYATPIFYPLNIVPQRYKWLISANPLTPVTETFRYAFFGTGNANLFHLLYSFVFAVIVLFLGLIIFNRVQSTFVDIV
jgi:lipopolysaccharide transport system permease protein